MALITIITPTYNRKDKLTTLYNSLLNQTNKNFEWLIIDDGSTDNTKNVVEKFKNDEFRVEYKYKKNGGKHTALNLAFGLVKTELLFIVDSDDYLTENAIDIIQHYYKKYKSNKSIAGFSFGKMYPDGKIVPDEFEKDECVSNRIDYLINKGKKGDKAEVFITKVISKYRFPEFEGERFIGEGYLWNTISQNYNFVFINKYIYVCEYLTDGLTKSGRKLRITNPNGGAIYASECMGKRYALKVRIKYSIFYLTYSLFAKKRIIKAILESDNKLLLTLCIIPSYLLYFFWKIKYNV